MFDRQRFLSRDSTTKKTYLTEILNVLMGSDGGSILSDQILRIQMLLELPIITEQTLIGLFDDFVGVMSNIYNTERRLLQHSLWNIQMMLQKDAYKASQEADALLANL